MSREWVFSVSREGANKNKREISPSVEHVDELKKGAR